MDFQTIVSIDSSKTLLDIAFSKGKKKVGQIRDSIKSKPLEKSKQIELMRMEIVDITLRNKLKRILETFPSIDRLPKFYQELLNCYTDYVDLKKSLGGLNWAAKQLSTMYQKHKMLIKKTQQVTAINNYRRQYYGRVSSIINQIKKELAYLEEVRKILRRFPMVNLEMFTVAIIGFPNVGKTTLLSKLTGSKPEINSYAFTTKCINIGKNNKVQYLDTPGTLDREDKMNDIERQGILALKYITDIMVYVYDITEPYPLEKQIKLHKSLIKYKKPILCYLSKTDILEKQLVSDCGLEVITSVSELQKEILRLKPSIKEEPAQE